MNKLLKVLALSTALLGMAEAATSITTVPVNLRRLPSASAPLVGVVPANTLLTVACRGGWCRTSYHGRGGYVAQAYVRSLTRSAPLAGEGVRFYRSCAAVRAAGKAPLQLGQPGFRSAMDANHNGLACEPGER
ncbi:SH3 domain-containing protein [Deinococcus hohokamensis]|uniref:SH3 domain-containing protein n=1 Tax=Deinococcus hohokamensis TaxID=309883 RepID=A0ABV9IGP2_9DEIO